MIERGNNGAGLAKDEGGLLRRRLREVLEVYDDLVPANGEARQAFAGEAELQQGYRSAVDGAESALSGGRKLPGFLQASADEVRAAVDDMTAGEREAYRLGAIAAMRGSYDFLVEDSIRLRSWSTPARQVGSPDSPRCSVAPR